ncbi:MAG: YdcF family protein [Rhodospirillales bacterium]|nr:YdcF family protein [Rhodospirillales bacterium]
MSADSFFSLSKLFWFFAEPSSLLLFAWLLGSALLWTRRWLGLGRIVVTTAALFTFAAGLLPLGQWLLQPIENRFPASTAVPTQIDGIIVLGGVIDDYVIGKRGIPRSPSGAGSPRLDTFIDLVRRYPMARHVFTGGSTELYEGRDTEADIVRRIFARLGVDTTQIVFEDRSRNTYENATFSYALIKPRPGERWLLITSARHMPRAVGTFRNVGWKNIIAYPIDYATETTTVFEPEFGLGSNLHYVAEAIREYAGLLAYYYSGRTDALFPSPIPPS